MSRVEETNLPGIGVRHDFVTEGGERVGVISHRSGRRELLLYDAADPDACRATLRLTSDDSHTLAELLGASTVTERLGSLQQEVEGVTIDWILVGPEDSAAGRTLRETRVGATTGVSIVAVVREGRTIPAPGTDFALQGGDTAVVVGTPEGIEHAFVVLREG
jgi:TrkA domain protein